MCDAVGMSWDRRLHQRLLCHDTGALVELLEVLGDMVHAAAYAGTGDHHAAEDVAQAVWLDVWARPELYDPEKGSLKTWLGVRARRAGIDWTRSQAAWRARDHSAPRVTPDHAEMVAIRLSVRLALRCLPERERVPIKLAFFDDLSYRQVATAVGVPEGTAKSRIKSGLARLTVTV